MKIYRTQKGRKYQKGARKRARKQEEKTTFAVLITYQTMKQEKYNVHIRERKYDGGRLALLLEVRKGARRIRRNLGLTIIEEPKTKAERDHNRAARMKAESTAAKVFLQIERGEFQWSDPKAENGAPSSLCDLVRMCAESHKENRAEGYRTLVRTLEGFGDTDLEGLDVGYIRGFLSYLRTEPRKRAPFTTLKEGTILERLKILRAVVRIAYKRGYIMQDPFDRLEQNERPKAPKRESVKYLTIDEVKRLAETPCKSPLLKAAFLFSCCCGLRISDIYGLRWEEIKEEGGRLFIEKKQEKTGAVVVIPLSETARKYLPRRGLLNKARPFECLPSYSSVTRYMRIWGAAAGLEKRLTFHVSRHTFGTQLVSNGVELLTASKLMGHTNVTTTQIYAEVVTAARVAAVDKLPTF